MRKAAHAAKESSKRKLIKISAVAVSLILVVSLIVVLVSSCGKSGDINKVADGMFGRYTDSDINNAADNPEVSEFIEDYKAIMKSAGESKKLEEELIARIDACDEYDVFTDIGLAMEALGYRNEVVKNAFDSKITAYYTSEAFMNKSFPEMSTALEKAKGIGLEYYNGIENLVSSAEAGRIFENHRADALGSGALDDAMKFASMVAELMEVQVQWDCNDILPYDTIISLVTEDADNVTVNDNEDGYYDSVRDEFIPFDDIDNYGNNVSTSYDFYGDFMIETIERSYASSDEPTEDGTEIITETIRTLFCKGVSVATDTDLFLEVLPTATKIYFNEGYCVAETSAGLICFAGNYTFRLPYSI